MLDSDRDLKLMDEWADAKAGDPVECYGKPYLLDKKPVYGEGVAVAVLRHCTDEKIINRIVPLYLVSRA